MITMNKVCKICNKNFEYWDKKYVSYVTCSKKCSESYEKLVIKKWNDIYSFRRRKNIIKQCVICNKDFIKRGINITCSKECSLINKKNRIEKNKESRKIEGKEYYLKNKDKCLEKCKIYYNNNKDKKKLYVRNYKKLIRKQNPIIKLIELQRGRIRKVLKNNKKSNKTIKLLGCTGSFLKQYLESKFLPGMSWDNHGKWHIDHIIPCASFDLSKSEQQQECFHYTNLQPLWAVDNLKKSKNILKYNQ